MNDFVGGHYEKNEQFFIFFVILFCFFISSMSVFASELNPDSIKSKLECNSEIKGKKFTVGIMGNF